MPSAQLTRLAQQIKRADQQDQSVWVPRAPTPTLHTGVLTGVDLGRNTVSFLTNDPSLAELHGVRVLQMYSPLDLPQVGHVVRALHFGTSLMVLGRQAVPDSTVILG